jgi:hypothetical protein
MVAAFIARKAEGSWREVLSITVAYAKWDQILNEGILKIVVIAMQHHYPKFP